MTIINNQQGRKMTEEEKEIKQLRITAAGIIILLVITFLGLYKLEEHRNEKNNNLPYFSRFYNSHHNHH